jgi:putative membrane protein
MPRLVVTWLSNCVALLAAHALIHSISYGDKFGTLVLAGAILGVVNFAIRPLVLLLSLPFLILSLGLGLLVVNAFMLWLTSRIVTGFHVGGFWSAVGGALVVWLVNLALRPWTRRGGPDGPFRPHGRRRRRPQIS